MFRDTKEELERLERALLAEEGPEEPDCQDTQEDWADILLDDPDDFGEESPGIYQNYSNGYGRSFHVYNTDRTDRDPETLGEAVQEPARNDIWLAVIVCALLLAIAGVLIFWILPYFL